MDSRLSTILVLTGIAAVLALIPSNAGVLLLLKLVVFLSLFGIAFWAFSGSQVEKKVQVIVGDVREDRRDHFRTKIIGSLESLGSVFKLEEDPGEVAAAVTTTRSIEDVRAAVDGCRLKAQFESAVSTLRYTSLEAGAEMLVAISGRATPGSTLTIDGVRQAVHVSSNGDFVVQVPMALVRRNEARGYIAAVCKKGSLREEIEIPIPK